MFRIEWRDPAKRRANYAGLRFDDNGRSTKAWAKPNDLRLKRFFLLNQHRQWFQVIEDAPVEADVPPPENTTQADGGGAADAAPSPLADLQMGGNDDDPHSDERRGGGSGDPGLGGALPRLDAAGLRHLGEADVDPDQAGGAALEGGATQAVDPRSRSDAAPESHGEHPGPGPSRHLRRARH